MFKRIILIVAGILAAWLLYEWLTFPDVAALAGKTPKTTAFMEQRRKELRAAGKEDTLAWRWVPYGRISSSLRRAVLVAEDDSFYEHGGVDVDAMREAVERDWKRRRLTHGGSTITQQLAKNLYLSPSRNPIRKIREYFIARSLERHLSKKRILELYLNVVEFGERVYGAEAAAREYFGVPASGLSASQAALLAGCLPNPRVMNPAHPNKRLRSRQRMILSRMKRWGSLIEKKVLTAPRPEPVPDRQTAPPAPTDTDLPAEPPAEETDTAADSTATTDTTSTSEPETQTEPPLTSPSDTTAPATGTPATNP